MRTVMPLDDQATRVVLIRHGEAVCNAMGVVGGMAGCSGLTDRGRRQVDALRRRLVDTGELDGATALYASLLPRAVETATILSPAIGHGLLDLQRRCALCELHPGQSDGLAWADAVERFGEPDWDRDPTRPLAPGGESWSAFVERAAAGVAEVAAGHAGELVVVACHAGVIEATLLAWMAVGRSRLQLHTTHASITEWEWSQRGWRLLRYNDAAHLAGLDDDQQA
jgi:probable phosphoglycerate mutase